MITALPTGDRCLFSIFFGFFLVLAGGCALFQDQVDAEIDAGIMADLKETLSHAPTDELAKTYDPLSLLQKAETFYKDKNFVEAAAEYEYFLNLHPLHRWASYAQYKLGLCYFRQIQSVDRDIEPVLKALTAFQKLLDLYPQNPYQEAAQKKIRFCRERLAEHEFYIGHFYYKKSAYPAAITRFLGIVQGYPELEVASQALYYLSLSYEGLGDFEKAKQGLKELLEKYPDTQYRREIPRLLSRLDGQKT